MYLWSACHRTCCPGLRQPFPA
uniref:Uncharacterized protein n=1 Tax=Arundo donax TaxID=35708 RepID=A0A0A8Z079_ARUDO